MNLRVLFSLPVICSLSNCASLNDPIYYDADGNPVPVEAQGELAPVQQASAIAPVQTTPTQIATPRVRPSSPFMQPDVLKMPSKDDLKETATSTQGSNTSGGLTVPNR